MPARDRRDVREAERHLARPADLERALRRDAEAPPQHRLVRMGDDDEVGFAAGPLRQRRGAREADRGVGADVRGPRVRLRRLGGRGAAGVGAPVGVRVTRHAGGHRELASDSYSSAVRKANVRPGRRARRRRRAGRRIPGHGQTDLPRRHRGGRRGRPPARFCTGRRAGRRGQRSAANRLRRDGRARPGAGRRHRGERRQRRGRRALRRLPRPGRARPGADRRPGRHRRRLPPAARRQEHRRGVHRHARTTGTGRWRSTRSRPARTSTSRSR